MLIYFKTCLFYYLLTHIYNYILPMSHFDDLTHPQEIHGKIPSPPFL